MQTTVEPQSKTGKIPLQNRVSPISLNWSDDGDCRTVYQDNVEVIIGNLYANCSISGLIEGYPEYSTNSFIETHKAFSVSVEDVTDEDGNSVVTDLEQIEKLILNELQCQSH